VLVAMRARVKAVGPRGEREIPLTDFFTRFYETALAPDEILTEVRVPKFTGWHTHYEKFNRVAQAWSMVAVAATVRVDGDTIAEARVGLTNMAATPVRATAVERALVGRPATPEVIRAGAAHAAEGTDPTPDADADVEYRQELARILTGRAVSAALTG
jgi:aerobic carbon-monoxide dehydrogenase medium subunit